MREIKFRVFSYEGNEMIEWEQLKEASDLVEFIKYPKECAYYSELMQYTGLKDINFKEIYEGDILQVSANSTEKGLWGVRYQDAGFVGIRLPYSVEDLIDIVMDAEGELQAEVIGNIYEDKRLLEEKK